MEPVTSVTSVFHNDLLRPDPVQPAQPPPEPPDDFSNLQREAEAQILTLLGQVPDNLTQSVVSVFNTVNRLGLQAAELGQTPLEREGLQSQADNELQTLRDALEDLSRDDLQIFAAVIQNQLPDLFSNVNTDNSESLLTDFPLITTSETVLESLIQVDLRTDQGVLSALDLAGSVLDAFSVFNTGSDFLESFLDDTFGLGLNVALIDTILAAETESSTEESSIDQASPESEPSLTSPGENPSTIIELTG